MTCPDNISIQQKLLALPIISLGPGTLSNQGDVSEKLYLYRSA